MAAAPPPAQGDARRTRLGLALNTSLEDKDPVKILYENSGGKGGSGANATVEGKCSLLCYAEGVNGERHGFTLVAHNDQPRCQALISKRDIDATNKKLVVNYLKSKKTGDGLRDAEVVQLIRHGKNLLLYLVHLQSANAVVADEQLRKLIADHIRDHPQEDALIIGDFNRATEATIKKQVEQNGAKLKVIVDGGGCSRWILDRCYMVHFGHTKGVKDVTAEIERTNVHDHNHATLIVSVTFI